jgi:predicted neuraminidase
MMRTGNDYSIRMAIGLAIFACCSIITFESTGNAAGIKVETVFGPEVPTGPYKHPSCFDELDNGDLYLVYYGGQGEYAGGTALFGSRLKKGSGLWSEPEMIAGNPVRSLGNGVVWQAPDGKVWLFYVTRFGDTWSTSRIKAKISEDGAHTWSDSFMVTLEEGTMVRGHPIVLNNGHYLLPIYHETGNDTEFVGSDTTSLFLNFDPEMNTWKETGRIRSKTGNLQPAVVQLSDRHLIAFCRRGGNYEPTKNGYTIRSESFDGGWTWKRGEDSEFKNPNSAVDLIRLTNGHLFLVYNDNMNDRTPLTAAVSTDGGKTFPYQRNIVQGENSFAYPTAVQTKDGKIHVVYTSDERSVVNHAVFEEAFITGQ